MTSLIQKERKKEKFTNLKRNLFLLFSTFALICLSLSKDWKCTIGLGLMWVILYGVTVYSSRNNVSLDFHHQNRTYSYISAFLLVVLSFSFYYSLSSGRPMEVMEGYGISYSTLSPILLFLAFIGSITAYHALYIYLQYLIPLFLPIVDVIKKMYRQYIVLSVVYILGLLSIIRSNFYYIDDLYRNIKGTSLVGSFSRYVSGYLSTAVHGNGWLTDISPLPQILAALIMALAAIIMLYVISERTDFRVTDIICLISFGLSPYFCECLSYKYDAPYMALSVLVAVFPLLLRSQSTAKYIFSIIIGTILVCTSYQVSAAVFPLCVAFLCFTRWNRGENLKEILLFLCKSASGFIAGVLLFRFIFMESFAGAGYVSSSISLRAFPTNIVNYATRILEDFNLLWIVLFFLIAIGFTVTACASTKKNKFAAFAMAVFALIVMFVLSCGLYSVLLEPLTSARSMYAFGILLSLLSYYIVSNSSVLLFRTAVCLLAWLIFVFTFTYGNALNSQKQYTTFRTEQILADLSKLDLLNDPSTKLFAVSGTIGYADSVENMMPLYPVLSDLVPLLLSDSKKGFGAYELEHYYGMDNLTHDEDAQIIEAQTDMVPLVDSVYHTIWGNDHCILIKLK